MIEAGFNAIGWDHQGAAMQELNAWRDTLAKHGLGVVADEDKQGHFLRVTPPVIGVNTGRRRKSPVNP